MLLITKWPTGSGEEDENVKSFDTNVLSCGRFSIYLFTLKESYFFMIEVMDCLDNSD